MQGHEDGLLVGEVLVERADADARCFRDSVGGDGFGAVTPQHTLHRLEDNLHGLPGALLLGLTPRGPSFAGFHGISLTTDDCSTTARRSRPGCRRRRRR